MHKHGQLGSDGVDRPFDKIDGVSVDDLAAEHGSPLFVFSESTLRANYRAAYRAFSDRYPKVQFAWSYKTNYLNAICNVFHSEGSIAEVVSDFEYEKARKLGVPGDRIIFNGPYKSLAILRRAAADGAKIQIDNAQEIVLLDQIAREMGQKIPVALRVTMETGDQPAWKKFGFGYENGDALRVLQRLAASDGLRPVGLHAHIGTFIREPRQYRAATAALLNLARQIEEQFAHSIEYINLGGGFVSPSTMREQSPSATRSELKNGTGTSPQPQTFAKATMSLGASPVFQRHASAVPSFDEYAAAICGTLDELLPSDRPRPTLYLETGRALVDEAGYLIATVLDSRRSGDGRQSAIIDAGVNLLYTAASLRYDVWPALPRDDEKMPTTLYGPLCMNTDVVRDDLLLGSLQPGDRLVIHPVGAYNISQSTQFIAYRPAVVMIGVEGQIDVIRKRETLEHVEALEVLPQRLDGHPTRH
jgi:diaminopimelate decarboxylase